MSNGLRTRVAIGSATPLRSRDPRSLNDAFGPYARMDVPARPLVRDRTVVIGCLIAIVVALLIAAGGQ